MCTFLVRFCSFLPYSLFLPSLSSFHLTLVSTCSFPPCLPLPRSLPSFQSVPSSFVFLPLWTYSCPFLLSFPILIIYILIPPHLALALSNRVLLSSPNYFHRLTFHLLSLHQTLLLRLNCCQRDSSSCSFSSCKYFNLYTLQLHPTTLSLLGELH